MIDSHRLIRSRSLWRSFTFSCESDLLTAFQRSRFLTIERFFSPHSCATVHDLHVFPDIWCKDSKKWKKEKELRSILFVISYLFSNFLASHLRTGSSYSFKQRNASVILETTTSRATPVQSCKV